MVLLRVAVLKKPAAAHAVHQGRRAGGLARTALDAKGPASVSEGQVIQDCVHPTPNLLHEGVLLGSDGIVLELVPEGRNLRDLVPADAKAPRKRMRKGVRRHIGTPPSSKRGSANRAVVPAI